MNLFRVYLKGQYLKTCLTQTEAERYCDRKAFEMMPPQYIGSAQQFKSEEFHIKMVKTTGKDKKTVTDQIYVARLMVKR